MCIRSYRLLCSLAQLDFCFATYLNLEYSLWYKTLDSAVDEEAGACDDGTAVGGYGGVEEEGDDEYDATGVDKFLGRRKFFASTSTCSPY